MSPARIAIALLAVAAPSASPAFAQSWGQLSPSGTPPASRIYHALSYDSARDRAVLFGGFDGVTEFGDTWEWVAASNSWTQRSPANNPPARQVMAYAFDAARGRTVMWGGFANNSFLADTWEWNGTNWTLVASNGPIPGRCGAAMVYDSQRQRCVLFGGQGPTNFANDVWEWNGATWTQVFASTTGPSAPAPRFFHNMVYDAGRRRVLVFGGTNGTTPFSDTWAFDPQSATWTQITGSGPAARSQGAMIYDPNLDKTLLYGGEGPSQSSFADTWILDGSTWTSSGASAPPARRRHVLAYRPGAGKSLMFGGQKPAGVTNELWSLDTSSEAVVAPISSTLASTTNTPVGMRDLAAAPLPTGGALLFGGTSAFGRQPFTYILSGTTFTLQLPNFNPAFRAEATLTLDSARLNNVLFGGRNPAGTALADTWTFANGQWTLRTPAVSPPARSGHTSVFDPQSNVALVFGGKDAVGAALGDLWAWDGTTWSQRNPTSMPPARWGHAMAYDARRARTVLQGGNNGVARLADVWEYDGTNWSQASAALRPSERHGPAMVRDVARNKVVLFGGRSAAGFSSETWEYSSSANPSYPGFNWARRASVISPPARNSSPAAYDANRAVTVLFGGLDGTSTPLGDTWEWNGTVWQQRVTQVRPAPRMGHGMAFDRARGKVVLFGGFDGTLMRNDTWEWDGATWVQRTTAAAPSPRGYCGMTFDAARGVVVMYGGSFFNVSILGDTWEYDGNNWTQRSAASPPGNLRGSALVWDETRNETLLFGGFDGLQVSQAFWSWNGTAWSQKGATGPAARQEAVFAFDSSRGRAVLFGGATLGFQSNFSDTWEWNGVAWTQPTLDRSDGLWNPGARDGHRMCYDPRSERVVLHGGDVGSACKQDVWSWDGNAWTRHVATDAMPSARSGAQMWHDAGSNELRVFGGGCGSTFQDDLWSLRLPAYSRWEAYGLGCAGSLGSPTLRVESPSAPIIGTTLNLRLTNIPGVILPAVAAYGYSRTLWNGLPLPVDLAAVGLPGCNLYNSAEATFGLTAPNGTGTILWPVPIPNNPALLGGEVFLQTLQFELPGFPRWGAVSNGVAIRIGDR